MYIAKQLNIFFKKADQKLAARQFLSGNAIKIIAICLMFFDHFNKIILGWYVDEVLFPLQMAGQISWTNFSNFDNFIRFKLYPIGGIAFPLFCFLIAEGFFYTKNRKKYFCLIGIFALLSELPFDIAFFSRYSINENTFPFYFKYQNVFYTLLLGMIALWCIEKFKCTSYKKSKIIKSVTLQVFFIASMSFLADFIHSDYGAYGVLLIVAFYILRKNRFYQIFALLFVYMVTSGAQPTISQLGSAIILLLYNGKRGKLHHKYFFYAFYPAHILLLYLAKLFLIILY